MLQIDKTILQNFPEAAQFEWLETNGLGGWSGSSVTGAHTRRYHGLLVAAILPPADRMVMLSKLDETIVVDEKRFELSCNRYGGEVIHPGGHRFIGSFTKELFPQWLYEAGGIQLRKTIAMLHGENTVLVIYDVVKAAASFNLELLPLMASRGYHTLTHEGPQMHWDVNFDKGIFHNQPDGNLNVFISAPGSTFQHTPRWFNNFTYSVEQYRGLDYTEDLFNHGTFSVSLKMGDSIGIIISTESPAGKNAHELFAKESARRQSLFNKLPDDEILQQLVLAADQFIVKRDEHLKTVIAGYHWFTDWGRDTMISLPGLTLSTRRFEDAKKYWLLLPKV
ncbi:MAG: glycogen debranching enzyme N-terminal domain-containing protein [Ferruginibacter sp.]